MYIVVASTSNGGRSIVGVGSSAKYLRTQLPYVVVTVVTIVV